MLMDPAARRTFLEQYAVIRHAEGRGSSDSAYYRALPFRDLSGRNTSQWEIRVTLQGQQARENHGTTKQ